MADLRSKLSELYSLEQLAAGKTALHRLHPLAKILATVVYLVCVVSFGSMTVSRLLPYLFYPILLITLADIPCGMILRRTLVALPFCLFAGVSGLLLNRQTAFVLGHFAVTAGTLNLVSILLRTLLCVSVVLLLVALTPFSALTDELRRLHMPNLLVTLFEMIYRYVGVLVEEASDMLTAYRLRSNGAKWPDVRQFGPFIGQLLLRSFDRAERVYHAMQCRLYALREVSKAPVPFCGADWLFVLLGVGGAVLFRFFNLPAFLGGLVL